VRTVQINVNLYAGRGTESLNLIPISPGIRSMIMEEFSRQNNPMRELVESVRYNWNDVVIRIV
jgi:hypothetical protein